MICWIAPCDAQVISPIKEPNYRTVCKCLQFKLLGARPVFLASLARALHSMFHRDAVCVCAMTTTTKPEQATDIPTGMTELSREKTNV